MTIAWDGITAALGGGLLIGLAAGGLYLTFGRIAGISGIFAGALFGPGRSWRWWFVAGLILAGLAARGAGADLPAGLGVGMPVLALAGFLVGLGTRLGNGCTSGHGVCGLSRLSVRSLAAVATFMGVAAAVVFLTRHVWGVL